MIFGLGRPFVLRALSCQAGASAAFVAVKCRASEAIAMTRQYQPIIRHDMSLIALLGDLLGAGCSGNGDAAAGAISAAGNGSGAISIPTAGSAGTNGMVPGAGAPSSDGGSS